jgi:hypothetical protein
MSDIFSEAERVAIWLGTEPEDSELAFELLREIDTYVEVDWQTSALQEKEGCNPRWADRTAPFTFDERGFGAVLNLQNRPWSRRLWVWQEIFLASGAIFMCGDSLLPGDMFCSAMFIFLLRPLPHLEPLRDAHSNICALRISTLAKRKIRPRIIELVDWTKQS